MSPGKVVVHTDLFLDHLEGRRRPSNLRIAMGRMFCYTTVFHAIELFRMAANQEERDAVRDAMEAMKVLGLNPKNAARYGELTRKYPGVSPWNLLIAGLCIESRLPLLTDRERDFRGVRGLVFVPTSALNGGAPAGRRGRTGG